MSRHSKVECQDPQWQWPERKLQGHTVLEQRTLRDKHLLKCDWRTALKKALKQILEQRTLRNKHLLKCDWCTA